MGHEPRDKDAGEGAGMKVSCARPFVAPRAFAASGRRGFVAPRWHENQAAAAARQERATDEAVRDALDRIFAAITVAPSDPHQQRSEADDA